MNILEAWGGSFYLLNKILLSIAEKAPADRWMRTFGWCAFLVGMPAWVALLVAERDWMAAANELGGIPSMLLALVVTWRGAERTPYWLQKSTKATVCGFVSTGIVYSLYRFDGITSFNQALEILVIIGFHLGSYLLARKRPAGWIGFVLMNGSMGTLMYIQAKPFLFIQQMISLCIVVIGYIRSRHNAK